MRKGMIFSCLIAGAVLGSVASANTITEDSVSVKTRQYYASDVEAQSGELSISEYTVIYKHEFKTAIGMPVEYRFKVGHYDIDEDVATELPSHLEERSFSVGVKFPAPFLDEDHYFVGVDVSPTFNTDDYSWETSAFRIPVRTYLIYKESDDFILVGGLSIRPDYDSVIVPIIGFIYRPNDKLAFNMASNDPNVTYQLNEDTKLIGEVNFHNEEFEVDRNGDKNVVLKYRDFLAGVGIEHALNDTFTVSASVGGVFNRRLEYEDDQGKVEPKTGLYTSAKVTAHF